MSNGDGPKTVTDWIRYLHNAAQEPKDSPHYAASREAMAVALRHINALNVAGNEQDINQVNRVNPALATAGALIHGLSLGTGEPLAGLRSLKEGGTFREGAQQYRDALNAMEASAPNATATAELAGNVALPAGTIGSGLNAIRAGVPLSLAQGGKLLAQGAASGAVPAGIAGFSAGGEDPGDIGARLEAAKRSAVVGAILGTLATGAGARFARRHVERVADIANEGNYRALTASRLAESQARLARMQPPELPPGVTADEAAVAKALNLPIEQVQGRVGTPTASPQAAMPPHYSAIQSLIGQPAVSGRPDLGLFAEPGPYQLAGPPLRTASPSVPTGMADQQIQALLALPDNMFEAASALFPPEVIAKARALRGVR